MNDKLSQFLDEAFKPYGDFPARNDIKQELLANLAEKFNDLKTEGKSDEEAYNLTVESFGDVSEIMENIEHDADDKAKRQFGETLVEDSKNIFKTGDNRFIASDLHDSDLAGTSLVSGNFSMSDLHGTNFDEVDAHDARFKAADLHSASFVGAKLTGAHFQGSDLSRSNLSRADLTNASFGGCAFKDAKFEGAILDGTSFKMCDLSKTVFDNQTLRGTSFDKTSINGSSFKNAILENVTFHHSEAKKAVFDGATMDKITYALLKSARANLDNVTIR